VPKNLVIVESPAKARTIQKFLGRDFSVEASMGHVRDLPKSTLGVDVEHNFAPKYVVPRDKSKVVKELKERAKDAQSIYLATDPDREGEAIAWHLISAIGVDGKPVRRIEFHEITREAIQRAVQAPRQIDLKRVDAQQARRVLDRLVGYNLSPLLWRKVRRGLSAGRVQSVAVRLVVEREREIEAFVPVEYWTLEAELAKRLFKKSARAKATVFRALLMQAQGKKPELANQEDAERVRSDLEGAAYRVAEVRIKEQTRTPAPPFTTSTLQQEAGRKLGFTAKRTMAVAQQLYEGLDVGPEGSVGLITYMRTDSTHVAESAIQEVRSFIQERYGAQNVPEEPRHFRTRSKLAQEAHEAIRPTSVLRDPARMRQYLTPEQLKLYDLIWKRFVASQMAAARYEVTTVDVQAQGRSGADYLLRATGSRVVLPGFLSLYREGRDDEEMDEDAQKPLPELEAGEELNLVRLITEQHFTQPPARYSEATLVKALEEKGIGRPSTYAPILSTIQERGYVERVEKRLRPTELGRLVNDLLVENFGDVVDVDFTANMEEKLDEIASGERPWVPVVREFYEPFHATLEKAGESIERVKIEPEPTDEVCEKCGRPMVIRMGRYGKFIGCSGFPECRNAKPLLTKVGVACPECGAELVERRTRQHRTFYGCSRYPECKWTSWQKPVPEPCPKCGGLMVEVGRSGPRCTRCDLPTGSEEPAPGRKARGGSRRPSSNGATRITRRRSA